MVATGGEDGTVRLWRSRLGTVIRTIRAHRQAVTSVQFSHDGEQVFSAGADRALKVWSVGSGRLLRELRALFRGHRRSISSLCLSPDGYELLTGGGDNTAKLWDVPSGSMRRTHKKCHQSKVLAAIFSRDGTVLVTGGDSGELRLFDHRPPSLVERDGPLPELEPLAGLAQIGGIAFSPDGSLLAAADAYDASQVLRLEDGLVVATYATARFIAFAPDGDLVAVGGEDDIVRLHVFDPLH